MTSDKLIPSRGYGAYAYEWSTGSTDSVLLITVTDTSVAVFKIQGSFTMTSPNGAVKSSKCTAISRFMPVVVTVSCQYAST